MNTKTMGRGLYTRSAKLSTIKAERLVLGLGVVLNIVVISITVYAHIYLR